MVKVSNLHAKVRFKDILDMFGLFGRIVGFMAQEDSFLLNFESFPEKSLAMNNFLLAYRRMRVELTEWEGVLDTIGAGDIVVFCGGSFDPDDIRDECSMFGHILEVVRREDTIYVVCETEPDAERIFVNMYGRFYNKQRIRCHISNRADLVGESSHLLK